MSEDGKKIVFGSLHYGNGDICIVDADGSNLKRLTNTPEYEGEPKFSPDGSKIVFVSERDENGMGEIYLMNIDGSNQKRLTRNEYYDSSPSFSPDGKKIVFLRLMGTHINNIFIMDIEGSNEMRLTDTKEGEANPYYSYDGEKIRYTSGNLTEGVEICEMNLDGTQKILLIKLEQACQAPCFSRDAQKIAFLSSRDTNYQVDPYTRMELWIMNKDGSGKKQLTFTKNYKSYPSFVPEGNQILFLEHERSGNGKGQIRIINTDGTGLRTIANNY